jgi:hypothetical protein
MKKKMYLCPLMESVTSKKNIRVRIGKLLLKIKAAAYSLFNLRDLIRVVRLRNQYEGIQLRPAELIKIFRAMGKFEKCNMLVFGLGYDSPFWCKANGNGRTVFLEDFQPWFDKITAMYPEIEAYAVSYHNNITQWREVLDQPGQLAVKLPGEVPLHNWDLVLVDGPRGHQFKEEIPGRMSSIYTASQLVGKNGYVFVHDAERIVESAYATKYLGRDHFVEKVRGRALLHIYHFPD